MKITFCGITYKNKYAKHHEINFMSKKMSRKLEIYRNEYEWIENDFLYVEKVVKILYHFVIIHLNIIKSIK